MSRSKYRPRNRFKGWIDRPRHEVTATDFETWYERRPWQEFSTEHTGELIETDHRYRHAPHPNEEAREAYRDAWYQRETQFWKNIVANLNAKHAD